ncbi:hypothetical protein N0V84_002945 [Fusarium piperis]|uniref:PET127 n=1 Tax=Fusarium piperis TaxID=1435070 RepID=A0A9W9BSV8_9HYPO|nr:hypothetical protein N0V84_002945 [Fusarium piperis]
MLRARRGAGLSANISYICRPYLRCSTQCFPRRSFATETNSDSAPTPQPSSTGKSEDVLNGLDASSENLQTRIRKMKKDAESMKARKATRLAKKKKSSKKSSKKEADAAGSDNAVEAHKEDKPGNFEEALDVVRKVYGVGGSDEPSNPPPSNPPSDPPKKKRSRRLKATGAKASKTPDETPIPAEAVAKDSNLDWTSKIAQQAGLWTSLREKLQHQTNPPYSAAEDAQDQMYQYAQHDLSLGPDATPFMSSEPPPVPRTRAETRKSIEHELQGLASIPTDKSATSTAKSSKKTKKVKTAVDVKTISPQKLKLAPVEEKLAADVPELEYNLDKVLFNPGVYQLQDKRSKVFNFDPYLATIMPVEQFDFNALKEYVTSSKDTRLRDLSAKYGKKYCGSTSSLTSMLAHFHFLLSAWRAPSFEHLSRSFNVEYESFTALSRGPAAAFARYKDGVYAIDADKEYDTANILSMLGKSMEKLLTVPKTEFEKYRRTKSHQLSEEEKNADEAFHYSTLGDFMLRSQLDAYDPRLPGTGMFDLKTRAVVSIRMDVEGYEKGLGYEIRNRFGEWESFEREYYDMIRAAFLKYSLQVRMGRMDGIFVAFHNTQRIFGFQYISLEEMDRALHGTSDRSVGDQEFKVSLKLLNEVLDRASKRFPNRSLRLHIETRPTNPPLTYFFAEPVDEEAINRTQETGRAKVEAFEREILGLSRKEKEEESRQLREELSAQDQEDQLDNEALQESTPAEDSQRQKAWDEMMAKVDETVENDFLGLQTVRDAIEEALEQSGLLAGNSELEKNAYLNSLVEALAEELSDVKDLCKESEDTPQAMDEGAQSAGLEKANETDPEKSQSASEQSQEVEETTQTDVLSQENVSRDVDSEQPSSQAAVEETPEASAQVSEAMTEEEPKAADATLTEEGPKTIDTEGASETAGITSVEEGSETADITSAEEGSETAGITPAEEGSAVTDSTSVESSSAVDTTSGAEYSTSVDSASPEEDSKATDAIPTEEGPTVDESASIEGTSAVNVTSSEMINEAVDEQVEPADNSKLSDASLKDLILRVAQSVDHKASGIRTFERVLSELVQAQKQASAEADEAVEDESEPTTLEEEMASGESTEPLDATSVEEETQKKERELLGMYITVRNKMDSQVVDRVEMKDGMSDKRRWMVEYTVTELPQERAVRILGQLRTRRKKTLQSDPETRSKQWYRAWAGGLARSTAAGQLYRKTLKREEKKDKGVKVAWTSRTIPHGKFDS